MRVYDEEVCVFFFQAEDGIRDAQESRGLGDVYKRQLLLRHSLGAVREIDADDGRQELRRQADGQRHGKQKGLKDLSLIHI